MAKEKGKTDKLNNKEPVFIIRPASKSLGLDYMHIMLIVLVIILIALAFSLSTFKKSVVLNCQYGSMNGTCNSTIHTSAQALAAAEKYLASYSSINTTLSLLPYYTYVNQSSVNYLPSGKEWLVAFRYLNPLVKNGQIFNISFLMYDSNLSLANSFTQTLKPVSMGNNSVAAFGTVNLYNQSICRTSKPIPVYVITDPYSPGMINTLFTAINTSRAYTNSINVSYFFIFSGYSQHFYNGFGIEQTQLMGKYLLCASNQPNFPQFVSNLSIAYPGYPMTNGTLYQVSLGSGLNTSELVGCLQNVTTRLNYQADFANLLNIVSTPTIIVNCKYSTIPQTINYAINYSLNHLSG